MKVSVIIPIYNGEKYIREMYNSLLNQTFKDFEVIYINDGSIDNSYDILKAISKKDSRIEVYSRENQGICASRNLGIEKSKGEYLIFLDQDDGIEDNLIEKYLETITTKGVDLASFGKIHYYVVNDEIVSKEPQLLNEELVCDKTTMLRYLFNIDNKKRLMTIWNCIYKKEIIQKYNIRFDQNFRHGDEDGMFNIEYTLHCNSVFFSGGCYYHYYIRKGISTITKYNEELLDNYLYYADKVFALTYKNDEMINNIVRLNLLRFYSNVYARFRRYESSKQSCIDFLRKTEKSEGFQYATQLRVIRNLKDVPFKYLYWDIFNINYKHKFYVIDVLLLELIVGIKKRVKA